MVKKLHFDHEVKGWNDMFSCLNSWNGGWDDLLFPPQVVIFPSLSFPLCAYSHHQCSLIIFQTATSLCMCFGNGLQTQRTVCLNLGQTRFTLLAVIMTQTAERGRGGGVTLHSQSHSTWLMTKLTLHSELYPTGHSCHLWGCECHPRDCHTLSVHTESPGGAGLWAGSMIIPSRGSERSVVECSCH